MKLLGLGIRATRADVPYTSSRDDRQKLDFYAASGAGCPTLLFVHGGFWRNHGRRYFQLLTGLHGNVGMALAKRGIAVAIPSYRLAPKASLRDQLDDVRAALAWTEKHAADPERIYLAGFSAGGHLVTTLALKENLKVRGIVTISGLLDVPEMARQQDTKFNEEITYRLFGRTEEEQAKLSPAALVREDMPPLLMFAAEHDYPYVLSAARLVKSKVPSSKLIEVLGHSHADMVLNFNSKKDVLSDSIASFVR